MNNIEEELVDMGSLIKRIKRFSVQNQIVIAVLLFTVGAMLIIGTLLLTILYSQTLDNTNEKMTIYIEKTKENIDQMFGFVNNTAHSVATSETILRWVSEPEILFIDNPDFYQNINTLEGEIKHILNYSSAWKSDLISYISIFVNDELVSYTYTKPISEKSIIQGSKRAYDQIEKQSGTYFLSPSEEGAFIHYGLRLKVDFAKEESLVILIASDTAVIEKIYNQGIPTKGARSYLLDDSGRVFSSNHKEGSHILSQDLLSMVHTEEIQSRRINGEEHVAISRGLQNSPLHFITLVPRKNILEVAFKNFPLFISMAIFLIIIISSVGLLLSRSVTMFLRDLTGALTAVRQGDYKAKMPAYKNEGVNQISSTFNNMTSEMYDLIQLTYENKIEMQEMEFKFLQQQINPHFLFNILLVIQIKAKLCKDEAVYEMLTSLSGLLRASLHSNKNTYNPLEEELKYARFYLYLQQQRFADALHYTIDVEESLLDIQVPRLTIEPIVENAVIHGAKDADKSVSIQVKVWKEKKDILVEVRDDGRGFDPDELKWQDSYSNHDQGTSREKIGLHNIHSRLQRLYGPEYGLTIHSEKDRGTHVLIRIRAENNKEDVG